MASGTIYGSTSNQYIKCKIEWNSVKNISANTSTVTAKLYYWRTNTGYRTSGAEKYTVKIGVQSFSVTRSYADGIVLTNATPILAAEFTRENIPHNADGSLSIVISAEGGKTSGSLYSTSCSGTAVLDTIPRATKPVIGNTNLKLGDTLTFSITPAVSSFRHDLQIMYAGGYTWYGTKKEGGSYSFDLPKDFAQRIPNAMSASGAVRCWTFNGDTQIGYAEAVFTASVSDDTLPSVSLSVSENVESIATQFEAYIKTKSKWNLSASGAGIYGSAITGYKINANGLSYISDTTTTDFLTTAGDNTITVTVTDSRGKSKTEETVVSVLDYFLPSIPSFSVQRANADGSYNEEGTFVKVSFAWEIAPCGNKNIKSAQIKYKKHSDSSYTTQSVSLTDYSGNKEILLSGIDVDHTYDIVLTVTDFFNSLDRSAAIPTAFTLTDYRAGGKGLAFGKVSEQDGFDNNLETFNRKPHHILRDDGSLLATVEKNSDESGINISLFDADGNQTYIDFVIEEGTSEGWNYRKWNNGLYECWLYTENVSASTSTVTKNISFPVSFVSLVSASVSPIFNAWNISNCYMNQQQNMSEVAIARLVYFAKTATSMTYGFNIQIIGKWK